MSKEQTPIERLKEEIERSEILSDDTKRILSLIDWNRKIQEEEEFTNAKVLEALERYHKEMDMLDDPTVYNVSDGLFKAITKQK